MEIGRHETERASLSVDSGAAQLSFACTAACFGALSCDLAATPIVAVEPLLGNGVIANTGSLTNCVAVMRRGEISFVEKALKAQLRKAVALVVINTEDNPFVPDSGDLDTSDIRIPVVCVRQSDGRRLLEVMSSAATAGGGETLAALHYTGSEEERAAAKALPEKSLKGLVAALTLGRRWKRRAAAQRAAREQRERVREWIPAPPTSPSKGPLPAAARPDSGALMPLWPKGAPLPLPGAAVPESERRADPHGFFNKMHDLTAEQPAISMYLRPEAVVAPCVIVLPGGGYMTRCDGRGEKRKHEGPDIAQWLNSLGLHSAVLHYRVQHRAPTSLTDAQRAVQLVRAHALEWGVEPDRICLLGFSAGGHLAAHAGCHWLDPDVSSADPVGRVSSQPDATVLCYPVINDQKWLKWILGPEPWDPEDLAAVSMDQQVSAATPPCFLWSTMDDALVPVTDTLDYARALQAHDVRCELHVYPTGEHGLALARDPKLQGGVGEWTVSCARWLREWTMCSGGWTTLTKSRDLMHTQTQVPVLPDSSAVDTQTDVVVAVTAAPKPQSHQPTVEPPPQDVPTTEEWLAARRAAHAARVAKLPAIKEADLPAAADVALPVVWAPSASPVRNATKPLVQATPAPAPARAPASVPAPASAPAPAPAPALVQAPAPVAPVLVVAAGERHDEHPSAPGSTAELDAMNESQLVGWLTHLGLEKHVLSFKEYEVTGAVLSGYDDDELKYCIRPKADREKLMNAIAALPATVAPRVVAAAGIAPAAGGADSPTGGSKVARRIAAKRKTAQAMAAVRIQAKFRQKRAKREVQAKLAEKHKREAAAAAAGASFLSHFGHLRNPFGVVFRAFVLTFVARVAAAAEEERQQRLQARLRQRRPLRRGLRPRQGPHRRQRRSRRCAFLPLIYGAFRF